MKSLICRSIFCLLLSLVTLHAQASLPAAAGPATPALDVIAKGREVLAELNAGQFEKVEALYGVKLGAAMPAGKLAVVWQTLESQVGPFQKVIDVQIHTVASMQGVTLTCQFQASSLKLLLVFTAEGKLEGLRLLPAKSAAEWSAPSYAKQDNFTERNLTLSSSHWNLPATLTLPKGQGPFPVVILVHGSGPNDQDESIGPNKVFKDLAWGLASRGIAVLRYSKRTFVYGAASAVDIVKLTVQEEVIDDVNSAVALAARQPEIDPKRVLIAGHSLGAYLAPRIALGRTEIQGLILLAAPARPFEDLYLDQIAYVTHGDPAKVEAAKASVREIKRPDLKPGDEVPLGAAKTNGAYWLSLRGYDPIATAGLLRLPMLVLQGERDYQVQMGEFAAWQKAFSGEARVTLRSFPKLNHLFIPGSGSTLSAPAEYTVQGHVSEDVIEAVSAWISAVAKTN
jgi:dienelactone hydrolase